MAEGIITFLWIDPCPNKRLQIAQEKLKASVLELGLQLAIFPVGPDMVRFFEVLTFARSQTKTNSFVWCNSDVVLKSNPYELDGENVVRGFHRRETPSGEFCGGVDMYLVPNKLWDEVLSQNMPDLWCGATHIDWWLTRAAVLKGQYTAHLGFIDHPSHPTSEASKIRNNIYYRHNIREYNKWAHRNGAEIIEQRISLPWVGESFSPISDAWKRLRK